MADRTIVKLNWFGDEAAPCSAEAIARGCTCSPDTKGEPVTLAQPDCPLHGFLRIVEALRSGEAELVGEPVEVDSNALGPVAGAAAWSVGNIAELISGARDGRSDAEIAATQGRGLSEIQAKAKELGLTLRSKIN